jgi:iron complex outermembrane receptor protein
MQDYTSYYPGHSIMLGGRSYAFRDAMFAANTLPSNVFTDGNGTTYTAAQLAALAPRSAFRGDRLYTRVENRNYSGNFVNAAPTVINDAFIQYEWKDYEKTELRNQVRAEATYKLDSGKWGKHTLLAGIQYMELESDESEFGPAYSFQNQFGGANNVRDYARYSYKNPRDYSPIRYGRQGDGFADAPRVHLNDFEKRSWDLGYYGVYQGQFWHDRFTVIGGVRYDRSDTRQTQFWRYEKTRPIDVKSRGDLGVGGQDAPDATSPQLGLSFAVTKNISVFGLYSTGIVPNPNDFDGYGNMMKPTKAKNYEAGVKFDLVDGRISGTISAYKIERENQPKYIWWAPSPYQSIKKGADPSKPAATVWWYAHPDALGQAIHHTAGMTPAQGAALARQIFPASWHPMINELAAYSNVPAQGAGNWGSVFSQGPIGSTFWNWAATYEANSVNPPPNYSGTDYMPLVDLSNPQVVAFMEAASLWGGGWWGNQGYTAGQNYRFGSGASGIGNTPDGNGASIPLNDEAKGWDVSLIFTPHDDIQILANFAHVERKITSRTFQFVKAPYYPFGWWMKSDDNFGTYNSTKKPSDVYLNVADTTTYNATTPYYNESGDDSPENTASLWVRCGLKLFGDGLKKWTVGFGGNWEDKRLFYSGFMGGGGNVTLAADGSRRLVKYYTGDRYTVNALVEYRTVINDKYHMRYALNIDNVLDDQGRYGLVYGAGSSYKLSVGMNF